jgi:hypothetical protein
MDPTRIELNVVDRSIDPSLAVARQTYPDHIPANSVWEMVDGILDRLSRVRSTDGSSDVVIGFLRIVAHGNTGVQYMGDSHDTTNQRQMIAVDSNGHLMNRGTLMQLRGHFGTGAVVELHGCHAGAGSWGHALVRDLENLWGVRVRASAATQFFSTPGLDFLEPAR